MRIAQIWPWIDGCFKSSMEWDLQLNAYEKKYKPLDNNIKIFCLVTFGNYQTLVANWSKMER